MYDKLEAVVKRGDRFFEAPPAGREKERVMEEEKVAEGQVWGVWLEKLNCSLARGLQTAAIKKI